MIRAALITLLAVSPAAADPDRVSVLLGSSHLGAAGFEGRNPGVFFTWENRGLGLDYSTGIYRNSYGRRSVAATAALPVVTWPSGQVAVFGGVAHYPGDGGRFPMHVGDFVPLAGVQIRQGAVFLQLLPGDGRATDGVISLGVTFENNRDKR